MSSSSFQQPSSVPNAFHNFMLRPRDTKPRSSKPIIRFFGARCVFVLISALGLSFSPLSLEAGQKKSGKSKKTSTSLTSNKKSGKAAKSGKAGKSGKKSKTPSGGGSSSGGASGAPPTQSPAVAPSPLPTQPSLEQLLQDILTNSETYKSQISVSEPAFTELQLLVREFGVDDIIETLKSGNDTAPFFNALKNSNVSSASDLISKLKDVLSSQGLDIEDFIYWASPTLDPAPDGLTNVRGGVIEAGAQIGGQVAAFLGQRVQRFQIAKYETTWSAWKSVRDWAKNNGYDIENSGSGEGENYPVRQVNWFDALKWCNAKSEKEGLTPVYQIGLNPYKSGEVIPTANSNANGYRLPTELEWEWAARGGLLSNGYIFSGSNNIDTVAWYYNNSGSAGSPQIYTKPILTKLPNELGIYDMSGNVSEWCFDTFFSANTTRAYSRGGSSSTYDVGCTVIVRAGHYALASRQVNLGFRVARNASVYTAPPPSPTQTTSIQLISISGGKLPQTSSLGGVEIFAFKIGKYEVTYGQWRDVVNWASSRGYEFGSSDFYQNLRYMGGWSSIPDNYPVVGVSWDDCAKWCNALSEKEGLIPFYIVDQNTFKTGEYPFDQTKVKTNPSSNGYRLPTEAEWEWAARGGVNSLGYAWSGSNTATEVGWYYSNSNGSNVFNDPQGPYGTRGTMPVGLKKANELGIYDMSGNVDEWCNDLLWNNNHICRGGSWLDTSSSSLAYRNQYGIYGNTREKSIGFRVACYEQSPSPIVTVTTIAGSGARDYKDGNSLNATFIAPDAIAIDSSENIYTVGGNKIRKISTSGVVTTFATLQLGARLSGIAVDKTGNIYVSDSAYNKIWKITPQGFVSTLAGSGQRTSVDGSGLAASFNNPTDVAVDNNGNVYVTEYHRVRRISELGVVTTVAGYGIPHREHFNYPNGIAVDKDGNIYIADTENYNIRKISISGNITILAGSGSEQHGWRDGTGLYAEFNSPMGVAVDKNGNVYVADYNNHKIRKITPSGVVTTLAGNGGSGSVDGPANVATFYWPMGVALDDSGNVYVADSGSNKIRKITIPQ